MWHTRSSTRVSATSAAHGYCVGLITSASLAEGCVEPISRAQHPRQFGGVGDKGHIPCSQHRPKRCHTTRYGAIDGSCVSCSATRPWPVAECSSGSWC